MDKKPDNNAVKDFVEYQNNQYQPGAYLGGNIHPVYKSGRKTAIFLFVVAGFWALGFLVFAASCLSQEASCGNDKTSLILTTVMFIFFLTAGITTWRKSPNK